MSLETNLPLPSAAHRLMLGWIAPKKVKLYNFGVFGQVDEPITLHAASEGAAPDGRWAAAEVRLEDGKNYYFEYRPSTAGRIVDPTPPEPNAVLGTEAEFRSTKSLMRPNILLAKEDADAVIDRGAFAAGEDFNDKDTDTPGFEQKFIANVLNTTADAATIRVRYAADVKPDPGITPWSASTNWQSPDLEVINARSILDPAFHNIPWEGHDNIVTAKVTNRGSSDAHGVTVKFFSKRPYVGLWRRGIARIATLDIPANNTTVTFTAPETWVPAALKYGFDQFQYYQHSCIFARIDPFTDPVTNILEVTPENNEAQSNYTWMASTTSSPASREVTVVLVDNPFDKPAIVYFTVDQPHPLFRVYVNHRWLYLEPGEQRQILVMAEFLLGIDGSTGSPKDSSTANAANAASPQMFG